MTPYSNYLPILLSLPATTTALITAPTNKHRRYSIAKLQQPRPSSCWSRAAADSSTSSSTVLYQAKDNDRARMEKSWENMMGEGKLLWSLDEIGRVGIEHILCVSF